MGKEIEYKFLVKDDSWREGASGTLVRQGYLSTHKERAVRVRLVGDRGVLTIKGISKGATRDEFEYDVPKEDAVQMLDELCERPIIEKNRYEIRVGRHTWELDEFLGVNQGLIVAEIELASEAESFEKPDWAGENVTSEERYFNSRLVEAPYTTW